MNQINPASSQTSTGSEPAMGGRVAFVQSSWHKDIVDQCRVAFVSELRRLGIAETSIDFFEVPGAFEIPCRPSFWPNRADMLRSSRPDSSSTAASTGTSSWPMP